MLARLDSKRRPALAATMVFVVAAVVYVTSLGNGFAYDDDFIVKNRPLIQNLGQVDEIVTAEYWPPQFSSGLYRPLTLLSIAVDWRLWDGDPFGFHLGNLILHALVSSLVFVFLLQFFPYWAAGAGGLVFAVHSVHTEAVANVVGRGELLTALFILLGATLYVRAARQDRLDFIRVAAVMACYALAGFAKEVGVVMPGLLLATDLPRLARQKPDLRQFALKRAPLFAGLAVVLFGLLLARFAVLGAAVESVPDRAFAIDNSFATRLFTMARVWPRYVELMVFPLHLSADYSPAVIMPVDHLTWGGVLGFMLVAAVIALAAVSFRRVPEVSMAVAWFAIAILPVSNLLFTVEIVLAERTLYLPSVALAILVGAVLVHAGAARRRWVAGILALWVVFFAGVTLQRNPVWDSTDSVFEDLRKKHPESSRLLWGVASQLHRDGDWQAAEYWFRKALEVWPYNAQAQTEFSTFLLEQGRLDEAEQHLEMALRIKPWAGDYHKLLVLIRLRQGDGIGALEALDSATAVLGSDAALYALRADVLGFLGRLDEAEIYAERAVRIDLKSWKYWYKLATLRAASGDTAGALIALDGAERLGALSSEVTDSLRRAWSPLSR